MMGSTLCVDLLFIQKYLEMKGVDLMSSYWMSHFVSAVFILVGSSTLYLSVFYTYNMDSFVSTLSALDSVSDPLHERIKIKNHSGKSLGSTC